MTKIAVIYYSSTGNVHQLAEAVADGAREAGAEVRLRRVPELAPEEAIDSNPLWRAHVDATAGEVCSGRLHPNGREEGEREAQRAHGAAAAAGGSIGMRKRAHVCGSIRGVDGRPTGRPPLLRTKSGRSFATPS